MNIKLKWFIEHAYKSFVRTDDATNESEETVSKTSHNLKIFFSLRIHESKSKARNL